jgi:hypothetical protein
MRSRTSTRFIASVAACAGAALALAAPASAGLLVQSAQDCADQEVSQPFTRWLDPFSYEMTPGGSFEGGATGWQLAGGARVVAGNEPWRVARDGGSSSLRLPSGSSATSPPVCVGLEHPTLRFFARKSSGLLSTLVVTATVRLQGGGSLTLPAGIVLAGSAWTPTLPYVYAANLTTLLPGQYTPVRFRFAPLLGGDWQIDDVYVDPWKMSR